MIGAIAVIAWIVAALPGVALLVYSLEVAAGLAGSRREKPHEASGIAVAVLIPAHDEAAGIAVTVAGLNAVAPPGTRLLVVADNCADDTAARARGAGADVVERFDPRLRGKGYALAFGREALRPSPPDVVIVLDADCRLSPGGIGRLAAAARHGAPAQAAYTFAGDRQAPALVQISNFAFLVKNLVRARGLGRIGGCTLLTGSGMAFPWAIFADAPLASGDITEDLELGIALARAGHRIRLIDRATVSSDAAGVNDTATQRRRWEHGFLANALRHALPALAGGLLRGSRPLVALGLHLLVPPLALLFLIAGAALALLIAIALPTGAWPPALALAALIVLALGLTAAAWLLHGRRTLRFAALLQAPLYVAWKIPSYLRFVLKPERSWQRTARKGDGR